MKKYLLKLMVSAFIIAVLLPLRALAADNDGFRLDEEGTVTVVSQHAAKEGIASLSFSLSVESENASRVEFQFEESQAKILDYRYDESSRKLNIYMAGTEALFAEGTDALTIGRILVLDAAGNEVTAQVSVVEDSLQYVYGTEARTMQGVELPAAVQIGPRGQQPQPPAESEPSVSDPAEDQPPLPVPTPVVAQTPQSTRKPAATQAPEATTEPQPTQTPAPLLDTEEGSSPAEDSLDDSEPQMPESGLTVNDSREDENNGQRGMKAFVIAAVIVILVVAIAAAVIIVLLKKKPDLFKRRDKEE